MKKQICEKCAGLGIQYEPEGEDDFVETYCQCPVGVKMEKDDEMRVEAWRLVAHND